MKEKNLRKLIQGPLRFHHQDIHEEIDKINITLAEILASIKLIREELKDNAD
jgi:hypothetical protein